MENILMILSVALAPVIFCFTLVYLLDKYDREPLKNLILTFIFGILIAFPAIFVELYLSETWGVDAGMDFSRTFIYAMVVVAGTEEVLKFAVLRLYAFPRKAFDEPYDGIMYSVAASLGFAAIENVLYVSSMGIEVGIMRMFTAVPGHAMMGVVMGYYVGLAKFRPEKRAQLLLTGLLAAIVIHGLYDFFLMYDRILIAPLALVVLIVSLILSIRAIRMHNRRKTAS